MNEGHQRRREALAKLLAAAIMDLQRNPLGGRLPDEIWRQAQARADTVLSLVTAQDKSWRSSECGACHE